MRKRGTDRANPARIRKGAKKQKGNLSSVRDRGIKEALDAVYATEPSELDPFLALAEQAFFKRQKW